MEIDHYEGSNKGWWWLSQLLLAEQKCQNPLGYKKYCDDFIEFLEAYGPPPQRARLWGAYTHGTK